MRNDFTRRSDRGAAGFTNMEVILMVAVIAILAGTMLPQVQSSVKDQKEIEVVRELSRIEEALERYYYETSMFPVSINDPAFLGPFLHGGVDGGNIRDPWAEGGFYVYVDGVASVTVRSVGPNGVDDGGTADDHEITVLAHKVGLRRTRDRLRVIAAAISVYGSAQLANGLAPDYFGGDWSDDLAILRLGPEFSTDGWGNLFVSQSGSLSVHSVGFDGSDVTSDDLQF